MFKLIQLMFMFLLLNSCTYSVSMSHVSGGSTDTMEETAENTPNVAPSLEIPLISGKLGGLGK